MPFEVHVHAWTKRFGIGIDQRDEPISKRSDGEQARLAAQAQIDANARHADQGPGRGRPPVGPVDGTGGSGGKKVS